MEKMLGGQGRRILARPRPKTILLLTLAMVTAYYIIFGGQATRLQVVPFNHGEQGGQPEAPPAPEQPQSHDPPAAESHEAGYFEGTDKEQPPPPKEDTSPARQPWDMTADELRNWSDPDDTEDPNQVEPGYETDGKPREPGAISNLQHEKNMRKEWRHAYKVTADLPSSNLIYGNTLATLENRDERPEAFDSNLREDPDATVNFSVDKPVRFNPYPDYNSNEWEEQGYAPYVPCKGATGELIEDLLVFKGRPHAWPAPKFGGYDVLGMDGNLCWERETRLGPYGLTPQYKKIGGESQPMDWDNVNWGDLQRRCVNKNSKRYDANRSRKNEYLNAYPETAEPAKSTEQDSKLADKEPKLEVKDNPRSKEASKGQKLESRSTPDSTNHKSGGEFDNGSTSKKDKVASKFVKEKRTAVLLRSYTGKVYTENDKQVIRALVSELSLKSGGEYEVFLLVHVHDGTLRIFDDTETYQSVLAQNVPAEFRGMTVLWNDQVVWDIYTEMKDDNERSVHSAQWLSVQKFSHDHPQFDFIWNWEMDFRFSGQHYELLEKLGHFAKKQPRKGLWERNERWYIPAYHGDYDTEYRKEIEERYGNDTVWGPPELPFINPVGPKPPVSSPGEDNYEWGVDEDADVITVGPIFNPVNSNWIIQNHVWEYKDSTHRSVDIPRRTTIVTQSRISKRLLDAMHVENLRGNHVASEMTPQTVALLHGFKAVYAPHPVFMDRDWDGNFLAKWYNPGPNGESGGYGSPMGWGRERRYRGVTWYYRAEPPNRLYNNWMGWIDTGMGGQSWEQKHGRPCLPPVMLHHVKNTEPTNEDHQTGFDLAYG